MSMLSARGAPRLTASASATGVVVAAVPGKQIVIVSALITTDSSGGTVEFTDGTSAVSGEHAFGAGAVLPENCDGWFGRPDPGLPLGVTIAGNVVIDLVYALV